MAEQTKPTNLRLAVLYIVTIFLVALATLGVILLLQNISTRKREAREVVFRVVDIDEQTIDPAQWGRNFPRQYDGYQRTADFTGTKYGGGGSESIPASKLQADPRLVTIFAGYAFAKDYNNRRGHAYMLIDQHDTKRIKDFKQPGSCLNCHSSNTVAFRKLGITEGAPGTLDEPFNSSVGREQLMKGFVKVCAMPYADASKLVDHPVACIDCHDPKTMQLRVTKPGFLKGIDALAHSGAPVPHLPSIERWRRDNPGYQPSTPGQGVITPGAGATPGVYDPNTLATRQEMRSFVCGQCHVTYYCGPKMTLFFPWSKGLTAEQIESCYDQTTFSDGHRFYDWKHALTGAEVLKAKHPEFETWSQGIHARSGVACADCHMPYKREGAIKISDHYVRSPLLNISNACQTCHRFSEEEMRSRVDIIQEKSHNLLVRAEDAVVDLIQATAAARTAGATDAQLQPAWALQRRAQWRVDFVNAENSMGFHAPQETARNLGEAIDYARQGQIELLKAQLPAVSGVRSAPASGTP